MRVPDQPTAVEPHAQGSPDPALLEALLDHSALLVIVLDLEGRIVRFNRACEALTAFSAAEVIGRPIWTTLIPPDEAEAVREVARSLAEGRLPSTFINHWRTSDGRQRLVHWRNVTLLDPDGRPRQILGTGIDITHEEEVEAERQHSARQIRRLVDNLPALVARLDRQFRVRFANRGYRDWFGLDPEALTGRHVRDVIGQEAFGLLGPRFEEALAGRESHYHGTVPYALGGDRFIHGSYLPSRDERDEIDGIHILAVDLSEQEALRRQLSDETRRSRTVFEHAIDGIIILDEHGCIRNFNPAAERIFGYDAASVLGCRLGLLVPEADGSRYDSALRARSATEEARIIEPGREVKGRRRDGSTVDLNLSLAGVGEDDRNLVFAFVADITERKAAETRASRHLRELAHLDRRARLNELSSGLAHELGQPLTAIRATTEASLVLCENGDPPREALTTALEQISLQAARASEIVREIGHFLRPEHRQEAEACDPGTMLDHVLRLLSHEIEATGIEVHRNLNDPVCRCLAHRVQIEQVLFNLIHNAIQALAETQGERTLEAASRFDPDTNTCCLTITDNGPGIAEEDLPRIFEPFYTTRPDGLGQGLSICRSIVEQHGGSLTAGNRAGAGARFTLVLPCSGEG